MNVTGGYGVDVDEGGKIGAVGFAGFFDLPDDAKSNEQLRNIGWMIGKFGRAWDVGWGMNMTRT